MYTFHEEPPSVEQYNALRELAGWGALDEAAVAQPLPNSAYAVVAKCEDEVVGFARVVGDGRLCFYIQEIIVHPDHQRKGIATKFMEHILGFIGRNAVKRSYIGVFVGQGLEGFYERYGFWARPTAVMGPGMMQFWDDPEFNASFRGG